MKQSFKSEMMYKLLLLWLFCCVQIRADSIYETVSRVEIKESCNHTIEQDQQVSNIGVSLSGKTATVVLPFSLDSSSVSKLEISSNRDLTEFWIRTSAGNSNITFKFNAMTTASDELKCHQYNHKEDDSKMLINFCSRIYSINHSKNKVSGCFLFGGGVFFAAKHEIKIGDQIINTNSTTSNIVDIGCYNATETNILYTQDNAPTNSTLKKFMDDLSKPLNKMCSSASTIHPFMIPVIVLIVKTFFSGYF